MKLSHPGRKNKDAAKAGRPAAGNGRIPGPLEEACGFPPLGAGLPSAIVAVFARCVCKINFCKSQAIDFGACSPELFSYLWD
jgi:hypothetical protein